MKWKDDYNRVLDSVSILLFPQEKESLEAEEKEYSQY